MRIEWVTEAKANRGAKLVVVDPLYALGIGCRLLRADPAGHRHRFPSPVSSSTRSRNNKVQWDYVKAFTNAPYVMKEGFDFQDGLFTGYDEIKRDYNKVDLGL